MQILHPLFVVWTHSELKFVHVIHEVGEPHEGRSFVIGQVTANTGWVS